MPLETQLLELPFQSGIDQKVDSRWLTVGSQTSVINGRFVKAGAIHKRFGYTALRKFDTDGDTLTISGLKLSALDDFLLLFARDDALNTTMYSYSPTMTAWRKMDDTPDCNAYHYGVAEWTVATNNYDSCVCNGYLVVVYTADLSGAGVFTPFVSVIDLASGTYVYSNQNVGFTVGVNFSYARCISVGTKAIIVAKDANTTTDVYAVVVDLSTTSTTISAPTKIVNNYSAASPNQGFWDISPVTGSTDWVILYPGTAPTEKTFVKQITSALATVATDSFGPPAAYTSPGHGYAVYADANNVWTAVIYDDSANEKVWVGSRTPTTLTSIMAETDLGVAYTGTGNTNRIGIVAVSSTKCVVITSNRTNTTGTRWRTITTAGALGTTRRIFNYDVASKPFASAGNDQWMCVLACDQALVAYTDIPPITRNTPQGTYQLVDLMLNSSSSSPAVGRPIATLAPRLANITQSVWTATTPTEVCAIDTYNFVTVGSVVSTASTRLGLRALTFSFEKDRWSSVQLGPTLYMAGGVPSAFDGQQVTEIGFLYPPPTVSISESNTGPGQLTATGAYTYYVAYEYVNAKGERQLSASAVASFTLTGVNDTLTLTITNLSCTTKQDPENAFNPPVGIQIWRNISGGSSFYQLQSESALITNDPDVSSQTYVDVASDASIVTLNGLPAPVWPFQGGALEGYCPPAFQKLVAYNLRLWGIGDDLQSLWYSTAYIQGETPRFNDNFIINVGEDVTGLEVMDGALYIFTATGILRLAGNGPSEEGVGNDIQAPDIVPSEVGCTESRSVVSTSLGIFFQSQRGIYLLARGGEPQYVGQAVEDELNDNPIIKAATLVPHHTEVRFECHPTENSETGITLVYNYTFKSWSVFQKYDDDFALASTATQSSVVCDGVYYWLTRTGRVYQENNDNTVASAFLDGTHWVTLSVESANARASGIQGWGRFRYVNVLAENNDPHDLVIEVSTDFSTTYAQTHTFSALEMSQWTTPMEAAEVQIGRQKAASVRVRISDAKPTTIAPITGEGPTLIGLQLEVGAYPRPYRMPPAQGA